MTRAPKIHRARLTAREALLFEAGVKLGGIFHQYLGIPVSPRTAPGVARTIERAVRLQPYVVAVRVTIDPSRGGPVGTGRFRYRYLTPEMMEVVVRLQDGEEEVEARFRHRPDLRYPLMSVTRVRSSSRPRPRS
jgi:dihydroneopterin aldolase